MKKIIKIILSSSFTLALWFYFDEIGDKIKGVLFPKKTVLKGIKKELERINASKDDSDINIILPKQEDSWLDFLLWGNEGYKEKLKSEGIWETLWRPYIKPNEINQITNETIPQQMSTHNAVIQTDEQIKDTAIKSANHVQDVLVDYFHHNQSWLDYLIIQGFKFLAICIFFLIIYELVKFLLKKIKKDD